MDTMSKIKEIIRQYHPFHVYAQNHNRARLQNDNFTLLTSNCIGGLIYHELGKKFLSPTINTRMDSPDFIKFVSDIRWYLNQKLQFTDSEEQFPVAELGDIKIFFVHYKTEEEAEQKWKERKERINWDNIWIMTNDADGVTVKDIEKLKSIDYAKGIALFSSQKYIDVDFIYQMPKTKKGEMINYLAVDRLRGVRKFEIYFDYVSWLNGEL